MKKYVLAAFYSSVYRTAEPAYSRFADVDVLTIYTSSSDELLNATIPLFEEKYKIQVVLEKGETVDLLEKIRTGADAPRADVLLGGVYSELYSYEDLFEDYVSVNDKHLIEAYQNINGYTTSYILSGSCLVVNKSLTRDVKIRGYRDLLEPELTGKIIMGNPISSSSALELKEEGILHPYKFSETDKLLFDYDPDGYWYPIRLSNMVLAYNPEKYSKDAIPNSFKDFAYDAEMKGALSMGNPLTSGTSYATIVALLDAYGEDYFKALGSQGVAIESGSVALTKLETGECKEIMILEESVLKKREEEGSKLEVIYPTDGVISTPSPIMIVDDKHSANQNAAAAEAVEEWFLSTEGQKYIVAGWMHSVRSDYPNAPYDAIPTSEIIAGAMPIDWVKCYTQREEIRILFQENVTVPQ